MPGDRGWGGPGYRARSDDEEDGRVRRLLLTGLLAVTLALTACGGDDGGDGEDDAAGTTTTTTSADSSTTTTEVPPVDSTFAAEDVTALCEDLEGLADIDPDADPTQAQVDQIRAIAEDAPPGVAEPLEAVAAFGQAVVDEGEGHDDLDAIQTEAVEAATVLIAYGNEACGIDVPLFDTLAGV